MNGGRRTGVRALLRSQSITLVVIVVAGTVLLGLASGGDLFSPVGVRTFFQFLAVPILIGLAQMITVAVGQLNLAVGAIGGVAAALAAVLMADVGVPPLLGAIVPLAVGLLAGLANGWLVVLTRINGFIVTLATMTILLGAQYALVGTRTVSAANWEPLAAVGRATVVGVPVIFLAAVAVAVVVALAFRYTRSGRRLLASGDNPEAARLLGISNDRSVVLAHAASGLLCGVAALVSLAALPGVNQSVGGDWLLPSFAAPIIGGVSLTGGTVAVLGTVLAATVVRLVDTARAEFQLAPAWVNFVIGAVVLGTVALDRVRQVRAERRRGAERAEDARTPETVEASR
ncbi:ABC transporter permease [Herbiconiux flava]|uniref:Autoinducer 2 import system permease protein LsrC n=1 Tax=Herbiconiux flava TaxID=881268 RepID=A0A852SIW1_9MICO|nr:ABC transporter permease [Herbiconiux flava]NYD69300.1 ribose transport system permease protein [Herbiconiux flava]GLK16046.1 ABC transporter permease [Herbiconiux flava]